TWRVRPSALYRVRFEGIPPVSQLGEEQQYEPSYRPWPGERVVVRAERLEPAEGASVTVDRAQLHLAPGARSERSTLRVWLRASRSTTEQVVLPPDASLISLEIDGRPQPARLGQGRLEVPLGPGSHSVVITSKRAAGLGFRYAPRPPSLSRPLTNVFTSMELPSDRWLLATGGPAWGPAVLAWGYLVVVLLAALALGRTPRSPLRPHQWAILGLGLTQVEAPVALIVVGWLFALAYRDSVVIEERRLFNFVQVWLVLFTLVALSCLAYAVHKGLLVPPEMQVQGMLSNRNFIQWYTDRSPGAFPEVTLYSAPLWIYKAVMLLWALWLAASLVYWLRWGWTAFRKGGGFRPKPRSGPRTSGMQPAGELNARAESRAATSVSAPGSAGESADRERARVS
ncbi:MAG TPA: hypothetical protein VG963_05305, partial [Polyangiaceae bacterium]|nr:hypothetical protein [Polyangiaceae bacterium]